MRNNPLDAGGDNWNPPVVTAMTDTSVNINDSLMVIVTATDNGTVVKYVWAKDGTTTECFRLIRLPYCSTGSLHRQA